MSAAAAEAAPPKKGNKKLIIIIAAVLAVVLLGGGAALVMMKKSAAAEEAAVAEAEGEGEDGDQAKAKPPKSGKQAAKTAPAFVPLDPFTVNLADRESERYAQVGITLELADPAVEAQIKSFMPVIRNNILLALADSTATDLMGREGKARLATRIQHETSRALGVDVPEAAPEDATAEEAPKKRKKKSAPALPIAAVHFSNFIIQ